MATIDVFTKGDNGIYALVDSSAFYNFNGGASVDTVYLSAGVSANLTKFSGGTDIVFLPDNHNQYQITIFGSSIVLKHLADQSEIELNKGSNFSSDVVVFADGETKTINIFNAVNSGVFLVSPNPNRVGYPAIAIFGDGSTLVESGYSSSAILPSVFIDGEQILIERSNQASQVTTLPEPVMADEPVVMSVMADEPVVVEPVVFEPVVVEPVVMSFSEEMMPLIANSVIVEPDYPDQYLTEISSPGDPDNCARYCAWLAAKKAGSLTMDYMERPPGCTCPDEVDAKKQGFPVTKTGAEQYDLIEQQLQPGLYTTELPMTPQQIEAAVKREQAITQMTPQQIEAQVKQAPQAGGGLALAAIAALLLLG